MRRRAWRAVAVLVIFLCASGFLSQAQQEATGFEVSDLQLVTTASRPDWTDRWTAPVEAATIMAWFAQHGYAQLLTDLNGDRVVNELDTIELADRFGKQVMETATERGTTDALLVYGLAKYVAEKYPDTFELKIYDVGFPAEFQRDVHIPFGPDAIPGITLTLKPEPRYSPYEQELRDEEGVIVGIEREVNPNYYLAGRSFLFAPTSQWLYAVDLAWAEDDIWQLGMQGQVLRTFAKETDAFYLYYQGDWIKVEFMLALSPKLVEGASCNVAYDVQTASVGDFSSKAIVPIEQPGGVVRVEECVNRTTDAGGNVIDTYTYTVTNLSIDNGGCGLCAFEVPNLGNFSTLSQTNNLGWSDQHSSTQWWWVAPVTCPGIQVGQSGTFSFDVPGPTNDVAVSATVTLCSVVAPGQAFEAGTTAPGPEPTPPPCPDLAIDFDGKCTCTPTAPGGCTISGNVVIINNGSTAVTTPISVTLSTTPSVGAPTVLVVNPPVSPGTTSVPYSFPCNTSQCSCEAGGLYLNATLGIPGCPDVVGIPQHVCCPSEPPCPDLVVKVTSARCTHCGQSGANAIWVYATITNIGTAPTPSCWPQGVPCCLKVTSSPDVGSTSVWHPNPVSAQTFPIAANGGTCDVFFIIWLDPLDPNALPTLACQPGGGGGVDLTVTANEDGCMQECPGGDNNNADTIHLCCWGNQWEGVCTELCPGPDLKIESVEASCHCESYETREGQGTACTVTAQVLVTNSGSADAGSFRVSVDSSLGSGEATVFGLPAGSSKLVDVEFSFDGGMGACPLDLEVTADARGQIAECDETNNVSTASVCCQ